MTQNNHLDDSENYKNTGVLKPDTVDTLNFKLSGTAVTATAAELNEIHSVTPGTVAANSVICVDSHKHFDVCNITTLAIGTSGSETTVTSTAAELNTNHGVTAGTTAASSTLVVDASKNLDTLGIKNIKYGSTPADRKSVV